MTAIFPVPHPRSPLRLLVTGAQGQVGRAVSALARGRGVDVRALTRSDLDVTDAHAVDLALASAVRGATPEAGPLAVLNCAAYTAVDRAESEPEAAFAVNREGAAHLAAACRTHGAALVHVSTDYVFDGVREAPYGPDDPVNPLGVYGESKWAGEEAVRGRLARHAIVRTAWVFSAHGKNFVRTMAGLVGARDEVRVVDDQTGHPTWAGHLAEGLVTVAERLASGGPAGTVHLAGDPAVTWHGLAAAVFAEASRARGVPPPRLVPVPTSAYPTAARRPRTVRLRVGRAREWYGVGGGDWREGVAAVVRDLTPRGEPPEAAGPR